MEQNVPEDMLPLEEEPAPYDGAGEIGEVDAEQPAPDAEPGEAEDTQKDEEPSQ